MLIYMRKYNSYMNIIDNVNLKKKHLKQLLLWKTQPWSYVFKYEILKFREQIQIQNNLKQWNAEQPILT